MAAGGMAGPVRRRRSTGGRPAVILVVLGLMTALSVATNGAPAGADAVGVVSNFTGIGIINPDGVAAGPDGNMWFTNNGNNSIGRITPSGTVTNFTGPTHQQPVRGGGGA